MLYKYYFVYILTNKNNTVLYIGVTNNIARRTWEHKEANIKSFTEKYKIHKLIYYETFNDITSAITREKQLKKWNRAWKIELINKTNPSWKNLYDELTFQN